MGSPSVGASASQRSPPETRTPTEDIKQIARYISSISNSFNQVVHRVNKGGKLYDEDIADIRTTAEKFQQSQGLTNWADRENMKAASKALNEMNASNSTLEELESAAHRAFAEFMAMSTPQMELSDRIHEFEEQIPAIEKYHEFVEYHKKYTSL